ncbi:MAG: methyltransferase [Nocardioides sp.]
MLMPEMDPAELVGSLAEGYLGSRCLHVVANLGVADVVEDGPRRLSEIAGDRGVDAASLGRIVRHLASLGIFEMNDDEVWHNEASRLLRHDDPQGLLPLTRMLAMPVIWDSFKSLEDAVRTGRPGTTFHDPGGFFAYLNSHLEESEVYDEGMTAMTTRRISKLVPCYDFSGFDLIADIGGGRGHLLRAVLEQTPEARGVLFDRTEVAGGLNLDRISVQTGSFLTDPLPAADCYLLSNIIHDWSDADAVAILTAVRAAAAPTSTLLLFEFVIPEDAGQFAASDIDVFMLALVGGRERTLIEYSQLLEASGWRLRRTVSTSSQDILEAVPA